MIVAFHLISDQGTAYLAHLYASVGSFPWEVVPSHNRVAFQVAHRFVVGGNHVVAATCSYTTEGAGEPRLLIFMLDTDAYQRALAADPSLKTVPEHIEARARFFSINGTTADNGGMEPGPDFLVEWDEEGQRKVLGVVPKDFRELPVLLALVTERILRVV